MAKLFTPEDIRKYFYASCILAGLAFIAILYVVGTSGSANTLDTSMVGTGTMNYRHDSEHSADVAMAENASIMYDYSRTWGQDVAVETAKSQFVVTSAKGGYKTQYAVKGSGADHKVDYRATKISGDASFASEITLTATEAGGESFDSMIWFDTRDGLATIQGRVYNNSEGRPATIEELDAVGKYLLNTHLNVSYEPITQAGWLDFCNGLDKDVNMPEGIYILPTNDSKYNYSLVDGKVIRSMNTTPVIEPSPAIPANTTQPENVAPAARKERAAKSS
ncbi:TPA_asm: hypothetical protein vir525_00064 [Caudoviricetes sp. vir525]|nr:TPA_asm: hypothetical protein vir525_00064 [Caudoviricetes sp. vir525]